MDPTAATELKVKVELDAIQGEVDELISPDENRLGKQDGKPEGTIGVSFFGYLLVISFLGSSYIPFNAPLIPS